MLDIREEIDRRREALGLSKYDLVHKVINAAPKGVKVSERSLYRFLSGETDIKLPALALVLDAVGLTIKPK